MRVRNKGLRQDAHDPQLDLGTLKATNYTTIFCKLLNMSKYRRAAKVDANQAAIVKALRSIPGVKVAPKHDDILVGYRGQTYWYEVKRPETKAKRTEGFRKGTLKKSQEALKETWTGQWRVITSVDEILAELGIIK